MLARTNRVIAGDDFRSVVRRGRKTATPFAVYYVRPGSSAARFGVITSREVGTAVLRNRVRRRYRAIGRELVDGGLGGVDVVVRALPSAAAASWTQLRDDARSALESTTTPRRAAS